jgi:DNA integrity scanning protein DisA with diadenylate cyclase activity
MAPALLETIARMDGSLVMDRESNLLAFGAILRNTGMAGGDDQILEGGRTTAAVGASRFGNVLKISEDGLVSHYRNGSLVWEM